MNRARPAVARARADRTLTRNVTIAAVTLGCLCLTAAGVAVLGRDRDAGSLPNYVASHKALKIAWVEPEQQAQFERNPNIAVNTTSPKAQAKADVRTKMASRFDDTFDLLAATIPAIAPVRIGPIPLPHARPRKLMVAAIPLPRERAADAAPVPEQVATATLDAPATAEPARSSAERAMTLMSYAPATREQLFAAEVTGSIGDPLRDLAATPATPAKLAAVAPVKPLREKPAKPSHKLTTAEKLWGPVQVASLGPLDGLGRDSNGIPRAPYDKQTAVYVITDKKVYMPDGSVLEAHSGLGDKMDDPRFAHVRMRGVTPPHVYDLKMRESLFHGVEAIRMTPIGGEEAIFGRDGILAHSYMLGRNGQSNGCVSFKDYDEFLEAFKDGKINRLAVIAKLD